MTDRNDDQPPDEPLLPSLSRGSTVRLGSQRGDDLTPLPLRLRPQNDEDRDANEAGHALTRSVAPTPGDAPEAPDTKDVETRPTEVKPAKAREGGKPDGEPEGAAEMNPGIGPDAGPAIGPDRPPGRGGKPRGEQEAGPDAERRARRKAERRARRKAARDAEDDRDSDPIIDSALAERPRGARRGDVIGGRYLVEGQIGRGGMGRVLQVRHQVLGKPFALKLIKAPIAANRRIREMFYQEAKLASSLSHDNICSIVDFGADSHFGLFMVMELLEGQSLFHRLYYKGRLAPKVACDVIWQVAEALRYIHGQGIVHGDIKSENILLIRTPEQRRVVKLLDFGLARANLAGPVGGIEGTPEYLAPERIRGGAASTASDIYALGVLFYELFVGQLPFTGDMDDVFRMHLTEPLPRPSERLDGALDERADEIIARATAKDPTSRHGDVAGFMYELRTLMNMLGMALPGRLRSGAVESRGGRTRGRSSVHHQRLKGAAELFEHAPVPLASLDREGRMQVANQAFCKFVGVDDESAGVSLCEGPLAEVYPELPEDLRAVATLRTTVKRVLDLETPGGPIVEVAVILSPAPQKTSATAGEVHLTLHPLGRFEKR